MTPDERRRAAEEWRNEIRSRRTPIEDWEPDDGIAGHLAGQECGEKREREAIGQELLDLLARKGKYKGSTRDRISEVFAMQARLRGEHREGEL